MTTPEETEFQVARLQFFIGMEQSAEDHYILLAGSRPDVDKFARERAEESAAALQDGFGEDFDTLEPNLRRGFYRIFMDFTEIDEAGTVTSVDESTLAEAFMDIVQLLDFRWEAVAHEWSLLTVAMKAWESTHGRIPFSDPNMRFAYLYALVKEKGSATGHLDEARKIGQ